MANNTSNFRNDSNAEKVINEFLRKYFYQKIVDKNILKPFVILQIQIYNMRVLIQ